MPAPRLPGLRRSRLLPLLLLAVSPAAAGTWLPLIHPCPVDTPWLLDQQGSSGHQGHHGGAPPGSDAPGDHTCQCIGNWLVSAAVLPPPAELVACGVGTQKHSPGWSVQDASLLLPSRAALLPPSTAPPVD